MTNALNSYSEEDKADLANLQIYKFYPTHPKYDLSTKLVAITVVTFSFRQSANVNRYFGKATKVIGPSQLTPPSEDMAAQAVPKVEEDIPKKRSAASPLVEPDRKRRKLA